MADVVQRYLFNAYNVKMGCLQVSASTYTNEENQSKNTKMFITMAPTINKNVDMRVVRQGGAKLFNYDQKIVISLDWEEVAAIAKLKNPFYLQQLSTKTQKGEDFKITFFHKHPTKNIQTTLVIGKNQVDPFGCSISMFKKEGNNQSSNVGTYLTGNQLYALALTCEQMHMIHLMEDINTYKPNTSDTTTGIQSNSDVLQNITYDTMTIDDQNNNSQKSTSQQSTDIFNVNTLFQ